MISRIKPPVKRSVSARKKPTTQKRKIQPVADTKWRYLVVWLFFGSCFVILFLRAAYLQIVDSEYLQSKGNARYLRVLDNMPTRGHIVDRNGEPLAISTPVNSISAVPKTILAQKNEYNYKKLASLLGMTQKELIEKCEARKKTNFVYLRRQLPPKVANQIISLGIPGVKSEREYKRYYPAGPVFGHVLGFTNVDNVGQEGLELAYDDFMTGEIGKARVLKDRYGHVIEYVEQLSPVINGNNVQLSIDSRIQYMAYRHLQAAVKKHNAASASLVALNAKTGEVLAMVNAPDFNPNDRSDLRGSLFRNRAITDTFEPGSTVKPFTIAMAMDAGKVNKNTIIDTSPGRMSFGRSIIKDTKNHGELTVSNVIKKSSNIGSTKIAMMLPAESLYQTFKDLGFGATNKLKLQGEQKGALVHRKKWKPVEHATLSYGYGLSVNTLQLARAYLTLANDGVMMPISLHPLTSPLNKNKLDKNNMPKGKRVFREKTIQDVKLMMESVVSDTGTAPKATVSQYRAAGKTGTSHRVEGGKYQDDSYMSVFAGFAPVSDPEVVIVVVVSDPKGDEYYGGLVAAPVFSSVMSGALRVMSVAPDAIKKPKNKDSNKQLIINRSASLTSKGDEVLNRG